MQKRIRNLDQLDSSGSENRQIRLIMIHSYKKPAAERFAKRVLNNRPENAADASTTNTGQQLIGTAAGQQHPIFVKLHGNRRLAGGPTAFRGAKEEPIVQGFTPAKSATSQADAQPQLMQSMPANMFSATYQSSSNRYIPKLLLPRFTRPKMYSLNGYIPKPNVQKFAVTTSPTASQTAFQRNKSARKSADKQSDKVSAGDESKRRRVSGGLFFFRFGRLIRSN